MSFKAEVVGDSINDYGNRITTMIVTFPRYILAEFNTHRMFSRNSASSRAIPFEKMIKSVEQNPFNPIAWQKDHKGMQGVEYLDLREAEIADSAWDVARIKAIEQARYLHQRTGATKQICNRLLEAFMWQTVIVTATECENFFALRCPRYTMIENDVEIVFRSKKDYLRRLEEVSADFYTTAKNWTEVEWLQINKGAAEIHMMKIAELMWDAYNESTPELLKPGEWHIPFKNKINMDEIYSHHNQKPDTDPTLLQVAVSTVMAARTSYTIVGEDQKPLSYKRMIEIHDDLLKADPKHMSPFEHCAECPHLGLLSSMSRQNFCSGNFKGWIQYRKTIEGENITK